MPQMKEATVKIFNKWIEGPGGHYRLSDHEGNLTEDEKLLKYGIQNPFIQNNADVRIKFGGFLEQELLMNYDGLTVHSELKQPSESAFPCFSDLSIHKVSSDLPLATNSQRRGADIVCAVIKVRFIDYLASRNKTYDYTAFNADFECLNEPQNNVDRFLLIIDEGESMDPQIIDELRSMARQSDVSILSNNEWLSSENF